MSDGLTPQNADLKLRSLASGTIVASKTITAPVGYFDRLSVNVLELQQSNFDADGILLVGADVKGGFFVSSIPTNTTLAVYDTFTQALQAAVGTWFPTDLTTSQTVRIQSGVYTLSDSVALPSYCVLDMRGSSITLADDINLEMFTSTDTTQVQIWVGLLDGNKANNATGRGVIVFDNVTFGRVVGGQITNAARNAIGFTDGSYNVVFGVVCHDSINDNILFVSETESQIIGCNVFASQTLSGIDLYGANVNVVISNCIVHDNHVIGIFLSGASDTTASGAGNGIIIDGCVSEGNGFYGISLFRASNCTVSNNVVKNNSQANAGVYDGIQLTGVNYSSVVGNISTDTQSVKTQRYGLSEETTTAVVPSDIDSNFNIITGNNLLGNLTGPFSTQANTLASGLQSVFADNIITAVARSLAIGSKALGSGLSAGVGNTAVGLLALNALTSGTNNTALGPNTLQVNTTGASNVAIAANALTANTTGSSNIAIGYTALDSNTTGSQNIAIGVNALTASVAAGQNIGIGFDALVANSSGERNVAIGSNAGNANSTASDNVAIGVSAMAANTVGIRNLAIGSGAMTTKVTGDNNVAIGFNALNLLGGNNNNVAVGTSALATLSAGINNTALGISALTAATNTNNNTAVGFTAGLNVTTGADNTFLGDEVAVGVTTGSTNVVIGKSAAAALVSGTGNVIVGANAISTAAVVNGVAVGSVARVDHDNAVVLGANGRSFAIGQLVLQCDCGGSIAANGVTAVAVAMPSISPQSLIFLSHNTSATGTPGVLSVSSRTDGLGFSFVSSEVTDLNTVNYFVFSKQ